MVDLEMSVVVYDITHYAHVIGSQYSIDLTFCHFIPFRGLGGPSFIDSIIARVTVGRSVCHDFQRRQGSFTSMLLLEHLLFRIYISNICN